MQGDMHTHGMTTVRRVEDPCKVIAPTTGPTCFPETMFPLQSKSKMPLARYCR